MSAMPETPEAAAEAKNKAREETQAAEFQDKEGRDRPTPEATLAFRDDVVKRLEAMDLPRESPTRTAQAINRVLVDAGEKQPSFLRASSDRPRRAFITQPTQASIGAQDAGFNSWKWPTH